MEMAKSERLPMCPPGSKPHPTERMYRDQRLCAIGEGTNEIQRIIIARHVLGR